VSYIFDGGSIQTAINEASAGDSIIFETGSYAGLTTSIEINKNLTIEGNNQIIDAGIDITNDAKVTINNLTVECVEDNPSDLSSGIENIIVGVRDGKLIANNLNIVDVRSLDKVNLVGIAVQGGSELELDSSEFTLTDNNNSLVYGVYTQPGATATINNNKFNLENNRRTLGVGIELAGSINNNIFVSNNKIINYSTGTAEYMIQIYNSGSAIDSNAIEDYAGNLLSYNTTLTPAYIYNGNGYYEY
jgi:hypothetical protein